MNLETILTTLSDWGPVLFGIGFLAPLIAQSMDALAIGAPPGLSPIVVGLIAGTSAGLAAKLRGSWL